MLREGATIWVIVQDHTSVDAPEETCHRRPPPVMLVHTVGATGNTVIAAFGRIPLKFFSADIRLSRGGGSSNADGSVRVRSIRDGSGRGRRAALFGAFRRLDGSSGGRRRPRRSAKSACLPRNVEVTRAEIENGIVPPSRVYSRRVFGHPWFGIS